MDTKAWLSRLELIIPASIAIIVSILDILDLLNSVPWLKDRVTPLVLLLLATLVIFEALQERDFSPKIKTELEKSTAKLIQEIKNLRGVEILPFENVSELYNYIAVKMNAASKSIDDITWGSRKGYRTKVEEEAYEGYLKAQEQVCTKGTVKYREVSSLTDEHYFKRSMNLIEKGYYSYHIGYYDISKTNVPLISFIIVDSKEVVLGFYRVPKLPSEGEIYLSVSQPNLVALFIDYFETIWAGSKKVKDAMTVNENLINQVRKGLKISVD